MSQPTIRVLIVDDDVWAVRLLKGLLARSFPELEIETRHDPDVSGQHEIFFIDNDFHGDEMASQLASAARTSCPDALIIAFSGTLNEEILRHLINAGCNGVCDKSVPGDLTRAIEIVRGFIEAVAAEARPTGMKGAVGSLRNLLSDWNNRLDAQARDAA